MPLQLGGPLGEAPSAGAAAGSGQPTGVGQPTGATPLQQPGGAPTILPLPLRLVAVVASPAASRDYRVVNRLDNGDEIWLYVKISTSTNDVDVGAVYNQLVREVNNAWPMVCTENDTSPIVMRQTDPTYWQSLGTKRLRGVSIEALFHSSKHENAPSPVVNRIHKMYTDVLEFARGTVPSPREQ